MKNNILFLILVFSTTCSAQSLFFSDLIPLGFEKNITVIDAVQHNEQILVVGQIRHKPSGDIDGYLALVSEQGEVLKEYFKRRTDDFARYSKAIISEDSIYILENSSSKNLASINVYSFDHDLIQNQKWEIIQKESNVGIDLGLLNQNNLLVAVWDGFNPRASYPMIYQLNLSTKEKKSTALNKRNSNEIEFSKADVSWSQEQKESFKNLEQYERSKMVKNINRMIIGEEHVYIIGCENTSNITDYWLCQLDLNLNRNWEKVYEEESGIGGDWLVDGYIKEESLHLVGYKYNKKQSENSFGYDFNYLKVDGQGKVTKNVGYNFGQHEVVEGMLHFEDYNLQYGISLKSHQGLIDFSAPKEAPKHILSLLINEEGNMITKQEINIPNLDKIHKGVKLDKDSFIFIGSQLENNNSKHFLLKGSIGSNKKEDKP